MVARVEDLYERNDLIVVAAPNRVHVEIAVDALRHGVPVVVDKPLATWAAEADALVQEAERIGTRLSVFHNRRWDDDFLTVRRLVAEDALGGILRLESRFERFRPSVAAGAWRERGGASEGGGVLLDLGAHLVDQALLLLGPAARVYAELDRRRPAVEVEDDAFIALEHASGARSHLWMSAIAPLHGPRFRVSGVRGGFAVDGLDPQEAQLRAGMSPADPGFGLTDRVGRLVEAKSERSVELERGRYSAFYEGVVRWLREREAPPVLPGDAVAGLRVLDAARLSAAERRVIEL